MDDKVFRVSWEIDINADSPEEAVTQAVNYLSPNEPTKWCFLAQNHQTGEVSRHEGEDLF